MIIYIWYNLLGLRWVMIKIRTCIIFCHLSKMIRMGNKLPSLPCVDDMVHYIIPVFTNKLVTLATYIYLNQRDLSTSPTRPSLVTSPKIMVFQDHVAAIQRSQAMVSMFWLFLRKLARKWRKVYVISSSGWNRCV